MSKQTIKALQDNIIKQYGTVVFYDPESEIFDTVTGWTDFYLSMLNSPEAREDDKVNGYNGDAAAWFLDCIRYDTLKPVKAIVTFSIFDDNLKHRYLLVNCFGTIEQAAQYCHINNYFYDDGFTCGPRPLELWDVTGPNDGNNFYIANSDAWYFSRVWDKYLYE